MYNKWKSKCTSALDLAAAVPHRLARGLMVPLLRRDPAGDGSATAVPRLRNDTLNGYNSIIT